VGRVCSCLNEELGLVRSVLHAHLEEHSIHQLEARKSLSSFSIDEEYLGKTCAQQ
jgi:hypothetical protein